MGFLKKTNVVLKIKVLIIVFIYCHVPLTLKSHGGRTDSNGGHYNRKTGEYHHHSGKSLNGWVIGSAIVGVLILRSLFKSDKK